MTTLWQNFEMYVKQLLRKEFPDYVIISQRILTSGLRPDYVLESIEQTGVVDAKEKLRLEKSDIEKMADYMFELTADFGKIYVSVYTKISKKIRSNASEYNIEIVRTDWDVSKYYFSKNQAFQAQKTVKKRVKTGVFEQKKS